jgi:hypothetical protein
MHELRQQNSTILYLLGQFSQRHPDMFRRIEELSVAAGLQLPSRPTSALTSVPGTAIATPPSRSQTNSPKGGIRSTTMSPKTVSLSLGGSAPSTPPTSSSKPGSRTASRPTSRPTSASRFPQLPKVPGSPQLQTSPKPSSAVRLPPASPPTKSTGKWM